MRRLRSEEGSATAEFVIVLPTLMLLFLSTFELGLLMTRQVMLDRAVDLAIRDVRLGAFEEVTHDALKDLVCERAMAIPNCERDLRLEMRPLDPRNWQGIPAAVDCVDRADDSAPVRTFTPGQSNQLLVLRACALFDPWFPSTGLGFDIPKVSGGAYALVTASAFVIEPD
jgi:hypothetical protein